MYKNCFKRLIDLLISSFALIILFPLFLIIMVLIKIDNPGPAFFIQERVGKNQRIFGIYKFRTMVVNAEKIGDGLSIKSENDSRITKVGKFLRKTSLDELPQFINVFLGHMSIIGPRPPVTYHPYPVGKYDERRKHRFDVLPGISGLAQAKIRNSGTWDERIEYDLEYVENLSFLLDCKIVIWTIKGIIKKENIY